MEYDTALQGREGVNRRIAPRKPVERLFADLVYEQPRSFGRRPKSQQITVQVVDVSVEGALLLGPERQELHAGAVVAVVSPGRAVAEIRHRTLDGTAVQYGVRFLSMDDAFRSLLFEHIGRDRERMEDAWLHAR
jgi:hypothetical protein